MGFWDEYVRVTEDSPCPKCGSSDWCLLHRSGRKCICPRVPSGIEKGQAGYVHYLPPGKVQPIYQARKKKVYLTSMQVRRYMHSVYCPIDDYVYGKQAGVLRLSPKSLGIIGALFDAEKAALVFPMLNARYQPIGCRFRRRDGKKWSLKGGREGVFMSGLFRHDKPVFITEGPTDAAALVEAGVVNVLGRPNCSGGALIIRGLLKSPRTPVVVLSDPDEPGIAGAERLAMSLPNPCVVLSGPADIRDYIVRFKPRSMALESIVEVLSGCEYGDWQTVTKNLPGQIFDFSTVIGERHVNQTVG